MTSRYKEKVKFKSVDHRLELNGEIMAGFFKSSVDGIIESLNKVIKKCPVDVETLLLVGGFAESPYLREKIKAKFGNLNILLEQDSRLAVMKGAVLLGYNPKNIVERKAGYTYGYSEIRDFDRQTDPKELKVKGDDGKEYCDAYFKRVIEKGQILKYNGKIETSVIENRRNQALKHSSITIELWQSEHRDPKYCREEEKCSRVAEIVMNPPEDGWPDRLKIIRILEIKETEFKITVKNATTGEEYKTEHTF
jgi:molecular chaperone DnaK (HSP70)